MIDREDINKISTQLAAMKRQESYNPVDTATLERASFLLILLMAERDAAFKAGEDAMRERAAQEMEKGHETDSLVQPLVFKVRALMRERRAAAIRALANQQPAKGG